MTNFLANAIMPSIKKMGFSSAAPENTGNGFASALKEAGQQTVSTLKNADQQAVKGVMGMADMTDLLSGVTEAQLALKLAESLRNAAIKAHEDIVKMSI